MKNIFKLFRRNKVVSEKSTTIPLSVGDDEILLLCFEQHLSRETRELLASAFDDAIKSGKRFFVIDGNPKLHVIKKAYLQGKAGAL